MATYQTFLHKAEEVAAGTMAFYLEKPKDFAFKAGQTMDVRLLNPPETDGEGNTRTFSIASAPFEPELKFATRMRDTAFKRTLKILAPGAKLEIDGPYGSFTLPRDSTRPIVFLAGGIGITPFAAMARQAAHSQSGHRITLFYSNRRPEDAAFLSELQALAGSDPNFKLIATMTDIAKSKTAWSGETGYIDESLVKKYVLDLNAPIFYLAGPPAMVTAMKDLLFKTGVNEDNIRSEDFAGY